MTRSHDLKTWPEPFQAVREGRKRYEIRHDDRGFAVGDTLVLREWNPSPISNGVFSQPWGFTNLSLTVRVTYITPGGAWGLPQNLCVMSIEPVERSGT
jgi:hypothetical protein